ncbi:hypothetical protein BM221_010055 [Beauveria bassiana]|uniref:Uncharacterized protein n=1 Tax=Beauveria bassiana TaxID=176275 RepID=A0A2N6NAG7_BEABA|nr:hypothetical protein BM221_010055 [Beauveria bassiana]
MNNHYICFQSLLPNDEASLTHYPALCCSSFLETSSNALPKRKVADRCRFSHATTGSSERAPSSGIRKRNRNRDEQSEPSSDEDDTQDFAAIGYGGAHFFTNLEVQNEV